MPANEYNGRENSSTCDTFVKMWAQSSRYKTVNVTPGKVKKKQMRENRELRWAKLIVSKAASELVLRMQGIKLLKEFSPTLNLSKADLVYASFSNGKDNIIYQA